jgi:hypothetical protein
MKTLTAAVLGLILGASLWPGDLPAASADDAPIRPDGTPPALFAACTPGAVYVPGTSFGPVTIGMPLSSVVQQLGRAASVDNRGIGGHQWTRMRVGGFDVLGRDNVVAAVNLAQARTVPVRTGCGTLVSQPFNLQLDSLSQTYGPPSDVVVLDGRRYWLYNAIGLLAVGLLNTPFIQNLLVYPAGGYCGVAPILVAFGIYAAETYRSTRCVPNTGAGEK